MKTCNFLRKILLCALTGVLCGCSVDTTQAQTAPAALPEVRLRKTPNGGIQPQAAMDSAGRMHLVYFKGESRAGDLFYVRSEDEGQTFSGPIRVNSFPGSAIAAGTIRGAQIVLGEADRVHVAWNGSDSAEPKGPGGAPMLYTYLNDEGTAFEPQRNLISWAGGLDGGGAIAADKLGHVYVAWHAAPGGEDETERAVYLARSIDNGQTFERERKINPEPTGVCACCQIRMFVDGTTSLYLLYRAAGEGVNRDTTLLTSRSLGSSFEGTMVHPWKVGMCPMSSFSFAQVPGAIAAAWETKEQVYMGSVQPGTAFVNGITPAPGEGRRRKHPVVMSNEFGHLLFAWTEGTGWARGGSFAWQLYDNIGRPIGEMGRADGVPVWGSLSAVDHPDGSFTLLY